MSSLVSSSRLMSVTLPILGALRTKFPKWESSKINPEKVACFSSPNPHHQLTTLSPAIHHKFTTKNHVPTTRFHQNPQQKRTPTTPKKITCKSTPHRGRGPSVPQPAQALRLRRMAEGHPKIPGQESFSGGHSIGQQFERGQFPLQCSADIQKFTVEKCHLGTPCLQKQLALRCHIW